MAIIDMDDWREIDDDPKTGLVGCFAAFLITIGIGAFCLIKKDIIPGIILFIIGVVFCLPGIYLYWKELKSKK